MKTVKFELDAEMDIFPEDYVNTKLEDMLLFEFSRFGTLFRIANISIKGVKCIDDKEEKNSNPI